MKRVIESKLLAWKKSESRKPLIIRGVKGVGKTYLIVEFGKSQFENGVVHVDLASQEKIKEMLAGMVSAEWLLSEIGRYLKTLVVPGKTLLFFDNIISAPRALFHMKRLSEEYPMLHIVGAASFLKEVQEEELVNFEVLELLPLGFGEFLLAEGKAEAAKVVFGRPMKVSLTTHQLLMSELSRYLIVGGMPESVDSFLKTRSFDGSLKAIEGVYKTIGKEIGKLSRDFSERSVNAVLVYIADHVGELIKYGEIASDISLTESKRIFEALCSAQVIRRIPATSPSAYSLKDEASKTVFRATLCDIGLMRYLRGTFEENEYAGVTPFLPDDSSYAEQFVASELAVGGHFEIYFWMSRVKDSQARISFLTPIDGSPFPILVKGYKRANDATSWDIFKTSYPNCPVGLLFNEEPFSARSENGVAFYPIYNAFGATGGVEL